MEEDDPVPGVNLIPCVKWVRRGIAKANPEKVQLSEEELEAIINQTKDKLKTTGDGDDDSGNEDEGSSDDKKATPRISKPENDDKFDFDNYDAEDDTPDALLSLGNAAVFASSSSDPYVTLKDDEQDSEKGDDVISPSDNLILVGHVEGDASILEVYVYNEEEGSLYVHHDILLPSFPLCMEWLSYDPGEAAPGNLCAIGSMEPIIEVWDMDVMDGLEPAFRLGQKARKKKGIAGYGHKKAVLDLSWNTHLPHILASGSADHTVLLWDLDSGQPANKLTMFTEKVQSLEFHPFEAHTLVTGSCDNLVRVFDCRVEGTYKSWALPAEVERVIWDHFHPYCCLASLDNGSVHYIDCRVDKPVWELKAHSKEITGLVLSPQCPGMLITSGSDGMLRTWDIADSSEPVFVSERQLHVGGVQCLAACPEAPFVVCGGGDSKSNNFGVWEVMTNSSEVRQRFGTRELVKPVEVKSEPVVGEGGASSSSMDTAEADMSSLSLDPQPSTSQARPVHSKGGKKREKRNKKK